MARDILIFTKVSKFRQIWSHWQALTIDCLTMIIGLLVPVSPPVLCLVAIKIIFQVNIRSKLQKVAPWCTPFLDCETGTWKLFGQFSTL